MHRIDGPGATVDNKFTEGDPVGGIQATVVTDDWLNDVQEEVMSVLSAGGVTPVKGTQDQLLQSLYKLLQVQKATAFSAAGTATVLTLTPSPAISAYATNQRWTVKFPVNSGLNPTLNVSAKGAKNLKQYDATGAKVPAAFVADQVGDVFYDGVDLVLLDPLPPSLGAPIFTKEYVSSPQAFTRAGLITVPHGLGVNPKIITGTLICQTAENGWVAGDRQHIALVPDNDDAGVVVGFGCRADTVNVYARCGVTGPYGVNINTGATAGTTADANWRLEVRAYA